MIGAANSGLVSGPKCGEAYGSFIDMGAGLIARDGRRSTIPQSWSLHSVAFTAVVPGRAVLMNNMKRAMIALVRDRRETLQMEADWE